MNIGHHSFIERSLSPITDTQNLSPPPVSDDKPELCQTVERARQELVIIYNFPLGRLPGFPSTLLFPRFERIALFHRAAFLLVHLRGDEETNRRRRKEARKKEGSEKRRNERRKKWKTKGSRSPPQVEEASRDGRLDNTWDNDRPASLLWLETLAHPRQRRGHSYTWNQFIKGRGGRERRQLWDSNFFRVYIYIYIYTHCCGPVTMPAGRLIQWMGSRDGSPRLRDRSATTADLMDDTRQAFDSRSIWKLVRIAWKVLIYGWNAYALNT